MIHGEAFALLTEDEVDEDTALEGLQQLIDSGMAWRLEGSVGRSAMRAIEDGMVVLGRTGHRDYYGSYVPSRYEVKPGTIGSPEYAHAHSHRGIQHREGGRFAPCPFR